MAEPRNYTIGENRIGKGSLAGLVWKKDRLTLTEEAHHALFLPAINSYEESSMWGRFRLKASLPASCILVLRAFARNAEEGAEEKVEEIDEYLLSERVSPGEKLKFFENADCVKSVNCQNLLLYDLSGQYLWLCVEIIGAGEGELSDLYLESQGDNFMQTFPEIYQERGSFFHRYMSIFSSLYQELQDKIDHVEDWLNVEKAPRPLLHLFAGWLGLELEGEFLEEAVLRRLITEAYELNRIKGTRQAVIRLVELVLGEQAIVVERNLLDGQAEREEVKLYNRLYGTSKQDITVLINRESDEKLQAQLLYLLKQYKPVRSRMKLIFYRNCNSLDSYCFLDRNARLGYLTGGRMDENYAIDGSVILE